MGFWIFCLVMCLLIPAVMIGIGWLFRYRPPKTINGLYGYRTARSMKNQQTWRVAHETCGLLWLRMGLVLLPVSIAAMLPCLGRGTDTVGFWCVGVVLVQTALLVSSIFPVERALKRTFDDYGRKR